MNFKFFDKLKAVTLIGAVVCTISIFGCTTLQLKRYYKKESPWSILNIEDKSRVKIVDNFNKVDENQLSGKNSFSSVHPDSIKSIYKKGGALNSTGSFLEISYFVHPGEKIFWQTELEALDVSDAKALSFWIKLDDISSIEYLQISLADNKDNEKTIPLSIFSFALPEDKKWHEVIIPRKLFNAVDLNSLKTFQIIIHSNDGSPAKGVFGIDEIVFVGRENLYFSSLKDNLFGFPDILIDESRKNLLLQKTDNELLYEIAQDTWKNINDVVDRKSFLPLDSIKVDEEQWIGDYTSPTNVGLYLIACIGAYDLNLIGKNEAIRKVNECLKTLEHLPRWNGFHYNYYNTTTLKQTSKFVSTVDCAWLATGLIVVRQAFEGEIAKRASALLKEMDFEKFYDEDLGQLRLGYDDVEKKLSKYHYGLLATEARIASLIAIGKGDVPQEHWFRIYRTLPREWDWQSQIPEGSEKKYLDQNVFEGYYTYKGKKIVPSWGGSLFEFLMPTLVVNEKEVAPKSLGLNDVIATKIHIDYALKEKKYKVWGLSPCSVAGKKWGSYGEFGVPELGAKGYTCAGIVTPHASFLALGIMFEDAIINIRKLLEFYDIYGEYGFYDSVILKDKKVSYRYLTLDQTMIFISIVNFLKSDIIKTRFHNDQIMKSAKHLLEMEIFFE